jgi:drug/metabolite transporter (DMT)-like permease
VTPAPDAAVEHRTPTQYLAFSAMCAIWSSTFLVIRIGNETVAPLWAATLRLAIGGTLNFLIALLTGERFRRDGTLRHAALFGALNLGLGFALIYWGERSVPSGIAAVLFATIPLSVTVFAWAFGLQPLKRARVIAGFLGLGGVALIFQGEMTGGIPPDALLAVLLSAILAALSTVVLKKNPPRSTFVTNSIAASVGLPICLVGSFLLGEHRSLPQGGAAWGPILYLAVAGSLGAYVLYGWLITKWRATSMALTAFIIPITAVILGAIARSEAPSPMTYPGGLLVLSGVALALRSRD